MLRFGFGSRRFKVLIIHGPGRFVSFEIKVLLTVRERFWLQDPALERVLLPARDSFRPGSQA